METLPTRLERSVFGKIAKYAFISFNVIMTIALVFILSSIGSGLEKVIDQNLVAPTITDIILSPDIYIPLTAFFILILITIFLRKFFYRN